MSISNTFFIQPLSSNYNASREGEGCYDRHRQNILFNPTYPKKRRSRRVICASSVMMSDKTRSEEDCNGDIMTGIGLSHETLPTLREGSWAQMIHILHYMVHKLQSPKCVPQINRSFWLAPRVIVSLRPGCESAQKWPLVQMLVVVEKREPGLLIYLTLFFHPVLAFFFSKMSTGVDGDCSERGCSISDIFLPFHPFLPFYFTFQKWPLHFTSFTLALLFFYF